MSRWLAKFISESQKAQTDITDTLSTMSGLSGTHGDISQKNKSKIESAPPSSINKDNFRVGSPPDKTDILSQLELRYLFQERAAIREIEDKQSRVEAELGAIKEVLPFLEVINGQERLVIPDNAPAQYHWWQQGGQSIEATLRELGASDDIIHKYIGDRVQRFALSQGGPK